MAERISRAFYRRDVLEVAPDLLGKQLVRVRENGAKSVHIITETEAYRGGEDKACHASKGRTPRTDIMFGDGGYLYLYLIYGMYWMLNVVTATENIPQAVLIRGIREASGPGRLTRLIDVNKGFYGEDLISSERIWVEDIGIHPEFKAGPRVGIDYAGEPWKDKPWRYCLIP